MPCRMMPKLTVGHKVAAFPYPEMPRPMRRELRAPVAQIVDLFSLQKPPEALAERLDFLPCTSKPGHFLDEIADSASSTFIRTNCGYNHISAVCCTNRYGRRGNQVRQPKVAIVVKILAIWLWKSTWFRLSFGWLFSVRVSGLGW